MRNKNKNLIGMPEIQKILGTTKSGTHWVVHFHQGGFPEPIQEFVMQSGSTMRLYDRKQVERFASLHGYPKKS